MAYRLQFLPAALGEWKKLDPPLQAQFKKKLVERLETPHVPAARLQGFPHVYKIKLRTAAYRLAYQVFDDRLVVVVVGIGIGIGKRDCGLVYARLAERLKREA
jgi:mRNA interferase RelE/StbE